jgi:hypothetical protein
MGERGEERGERSQERGQERGGRGETREERGEGQTAPAYLGVDQQVHGSETVILHGDVETAVALGAQQPRARGLHSFTVELNLSNSRTHS